MAALQIQFDVMKSNGHAEKLGPALWLLIWDSRLACVITGDLNLTGSETHSLAYKVLLDFSVILKHVSLDELWFQF